MYKDIKDRIAEEYQENKNKIDELDKKIHAISLNSFERRLTNVAAFSMLPWLILTMVSMSLIKLEILTNINLIHLITLGVPLTIGVISENMLYKKSKLKKQLKKESDAITNEKLLEEKIRNEIEKVKLENKNDVLASTFKNVVAKEEVIESLGKEFNLSKKDNSDSQEELEKLVEEKNKELELLSTKNVLKEKFSSVRNNFNKYDDMITHGILGGVMVMMIWSAPNIAVGSILKQGSSLLNIFIPLILGATVTAGYIIQNDNTYKNVFKKINNELGDDALPEKTKVSKIVTNSEENNIERFDKEIFNTKIQLSEARLQLEMLKHDMNNTDINETNNKVTISNDLEITNDYNTDLSYQEDKPKTLAKKLK
ncbi:MAG: hypothetical protein IJ574_01825 [Bacilli bacterium]|nr:hypothetical protein [Bacilli bacterium]